MSEAFIKARDFLLKHREDYETAYRQFEWPEVDQFNWALDYFDRLAEGNNRLALMVVDEAGNETRLTFAEMRQRSNRVANFLRGQGAKRGDTLMVMLPNVVAIWEIMLAAIKLGVVVTPATTLLTSEDLQDRIERGRVRHVVADVAAADKLAGLAGSFSRVVVGGAMDGWVSYDEAGKYPSEFAQDGPTKASDPLLLYFTSGTTAKPKLVTHTHRSYPIGHLSTMYWVGLLPGDIHLNISSPGWAKHAWSSFFAPWNAEACIFVFNYGRFDSKKTLDVVARYGITTLCAPPTVWRALILEDLASYKVKLREVVSAGEPLNPEVIERVRDAWGLTIRDGYGQTETTAQIGNSPGQLLKSGSMGKALPGYRVALIDPLGKESKDGEISLRLNPNPAGLMTEYAGDPAGTQAALGGAYYGTRDVAMRDPDGYFWYVGRTDDVFKSSDYRLSPFELESILVEHRAVAEAAVVPSPDPRRFTVPKAFVVLKPRFEPSADLAQDILNFVRGRVAPYKRIRRLEFSDLPKTVSGKIRRVELRNVESERRAAGLKGDQEFWEEDFSGTSAAKDR